MQVPQLEFPTHAFHPAEERVKHVSQHVATVKGHHRNQVGKTKKDVDPHQPKHQVAEKHQNIGAQDAANDSITSYHQRLFKGVNRYPSKFKRNQQNRQNVDCLLYTSPSPRDLSTSRMPSSA